MPKMIRNGLIFVSLLGVLLALDLLNQGLVWRWWHSLQSENTSTLPQEQRTIGETHKTDVTFLS